MGEAMSERRCEPISDERLAEIRDVYADDHEVIGELLAEVKRQRFEIARANQEIETLSAEVEADNGEAEKARAELADATTRAETAERELAEVRALDDENVGSEHRPLTKRELRNIGMAVVGPLKYVPDRWDHETVVKLYWALSITPAELAELLNAAEIGTGINTLADAVRRAGGSAHV